MQHELPKRYILVGASQLAACVNYIKGYTGDVIQVDIKKYVPEHTDSQQGYFHAGCKIMGDALGYTQEDIKRLVKKELWGTEVHVVAGIEFEIYKSMAKGKTNKMDYSDAIETLLRMASQEGVYIPDPDKFRREQ